MSIRRKITELSTIEFTGSKAITEYSREGRDLARDLSIEFSFGADDVYGALVASQKGHPLLLGIDVKWRARRVAHRLERAAELAAAAGVELVRFHTQFRREFADILNPPKARPKFDFKDD